MNIQNLRNIIKEIVSKTMFNWKKYYPKLEYVDNQHIKIYHYGKIGIKALDPIKAKQNVNIYTPDFSKWSKPRVFFYVHKRDKELRVDGNLYTIIYSLEKLYPLDYDPLNLGKGCEIDVCLFERIVKKGYTGLISNWGKTQRVEIWEKVLIPEDQIEKDEKQYYIPELDKYVPEKEYKQYIKKNPSFGF